MAAGHPSWCVSHDNGIHRSRFWARSQPGHHPVAVRAFLWQQDLPDGPLVGIGLDIRMSEEQCECLLDLGQARVLRYALTRLLDHAKQG
ncbi:hypothetical protein [Micromonospora chersina]|uniref:hypothetical protein n=1 Tax=Micromonospora chersina TaxID=47854 RepID=UPI0033BFA22C